MATKPEQQPNVPYYQEPKHATMLVWIGVVIVTIFLLILWGMNAQSFVSDVLRDDETEEGLLLRSVTDDFAAALTSVQLKEQQEAARQAAITQAANKKAATEAAAKKQETDTVLRGLITSINATTTTSTEE